MKKPIGLLALALLLGGCGEQGGETAPAPAETQAAAPAAAPVQVAPAAATPAEAAPAAEAKDAPAYEPIDVSTLENNWYRQFSGGR